MSKRGQDRENAVGNAVAAGGVPQGGRLAGAKGTKHGGSEIGSDVESRRVVTHQQRSQGAFDAWLQRNRAA